jgi:hypothetical protein
MKKIFYSATLLLISPLLRSCENENGTIFWQKEDKVIICLKNRTKPITLPGRIFKCLEHGAIVLHHKGTFALYDSNVKLIMNNALKASVWNSSTGKIYLQKDTTLIVHSTKNGEISINGTHLNEKQKKQISAALNQIYSKYTLIDSNPNYPYSKSILCDKKYFEAIESIRNDMGSSKKQIL